MTIEISNQTSVEFDEDPLITLVQQILSDHGFTRGEISIAIVDDPSMRELNRQYLNHDYETDVLSFLLGSDANQSRIDGQLIISIDTAQREAKERGIPWPHELALYTAHGTLHLVGFDDHDDEMKKKMREAERYYLAPFGIEPIWNQDDDGVKEA